MHSPERIIRAKERTLSARVANNTPSPTVLDTQKFALSAFLRGRKPVIGDGESARRHATGTAKIRDGLLPRLEDSRSGNADRQHALDLIGQRGARIRERTILSLRRRTNEINE